MLTSAQVEHIQKTLTDFRRWLDGYGEVSVDHQSFFAGRLGRGAKALYYRNKALGTLAVSPMIFSEAFLPSARHLFWKPQRFPIADAHYAMGFAFLAHAFDDRIQYQKAVHFLEVLKATRVPGFEDYGWGYPFDWETRTGTMRSGTPLITSVPYAYEAFRAVFEIDRNPEWRAVMNSIARHAANDYHDLETSPGAASCSYTPDPQDRCGVVNASAYRAFLLTQAAADFGDDRYAAIAKKNLRFVLEAQNSDGSWFYSIDGVRDFVDHFHTCFVLKALAKIETITADRDCTEAIERGVAYYTKSLFDETGMPMPFSRRPRMTVYKRELYDCAECINLGFLVRGRFPALDRNVDQVLQLNDWVKPDGSFRSRQLLLGWDNVPMHRWAQSQMFRSLSFALLRHKQTLESTLTNVGSVS